MDLPMDLPIGHILVQQGVLSEKQVATILQEQERTGRPFGVLAESMFGVSAKEVENAWAEQYARMAEWVDPSVAQVDPVVLGMVSRRQAWQFSILPLGMQGETLRACTTRQNLSRALNFATKQFPGACYFLLSEPESLTRALQRHYPMDGMSQETLGNPSGLRAAAPVRPSVKPLLSKPSVKPAPAKADAKSPAKAATKAPPKTPAKAAPKAAVRK